MKKKQSILAAYVAVIVLAAGIAAHAQTLSEIYQLPNSLLQGNDPQYVTLMQATDGDFYGAMYGGGAGQGTSGCGANFILCGGVIFKISSSGSYSLLYSFCSAAGCPDGRSPQAGLVQASDGNFYGTTYAGGTYNDGTIFRISSAGVLTTLHSFCQSPNTCNPIDGSGPISTLIQASNGALYGTTNDGHVFKITTAGVYTPVYAFPAGTSINASLLQAVNGNLYGATFTGGAYGHGSIFQMTLAGSVTTLYSFCSSGGSCTDGSDPAGALVQGNDGNFYGTTSGGATDGLGTAFKISPAGKLKTLHVFVGNNNGNQDGANPEGPLALATDGNFYGTADNGGTGGGTLFQIAANGTYTNLTPLGGNCTGSHILGGLLQSTNGNFYGLNQGFECASAATFFEYSAGLGPFVSTTTSVGKAGSSVVILGYGLTGTTSVTFNGTSAVFKVVSDTEILTKVPSGATSGTVQVTTPAGILDSSRTYIVK